ncbi:protein of unknown function [Chryseobacterium sp. JV274]|nr:protein of unknown function [Chryseobacterium sp. JV274]
MINNIIYLDKYLSRFLLTTSKLFKSKLCKLTNTKYRKNTYR